VKQRYLISEYIHTESTIQTAFWSSLLHWDTSCKIWGFYSGDYEEYCLLGYTPCGSCKNPRFGGIHCLHHQGHKNRWARNNVSNTYYVIVFLCSVLSLIVTATVVPSSPILVILMMEGISSSETSVLTRATQRNIPEEAFWDSLVTYMTDYCHQDLKTSVWLLMTKRFTFMTMLPWSVVNWSIQCPKQLILWTRALVVKWSMWGWQLPHPVRRLKMYQTLSTVAFMPQSVCCSGKHKSP
jgi:hypothetical protein